MIEVAAIAVITILSMLTIFQSALIAGAPLGRFAWGGGHRVLPRSLRIGSAVSILLYIIFAVIILSKSGFVAMWEGSRFVEYGIWVLTGYFALGIVMNAISRSKPERLVMTPTVYVLAVLTYIVARG